MRTTTFSCLAAGALALATAGCNDFLTGDGVDRTPNAATDLTEAGPLYVSLQAGASLVFEGAIARTAAMYVQQVSGINRQQQGFDFYNTGAGDIDPSWIQLFGAGGASDARRMQDIARKQNDSLYVGIAKVWEAMFVGEAASVFGAVPYGEAFQSDKYPTPAFDPQLQVYAEVQTQLDSAITVFLAAKPATNSASTNQGPSGFLPRGAQRSFEITYAGRDPADLRDAYLKVAHTLKARFYLHTAEKDPSAYAKALAETKKGIDDPADDMLLFHAADPSGSNNVWVQFQQTRTDLGPGAAIVNLMKSRVTAGTDTPDRFDYYFVNFFSGDPCRPVAECLGFRPGLNIALPGGSTGSEDRFPNTVDFNWVNLNPETKQPVVTFAENQLIAAEAAFRTGGQGSAQPYLDAVRASQNYGETTFPAQKPIPATLQNIMEEKYIDLYLNIESWNDYKRTCLPYLAPAPSNTTSSQPRTEIPGRLPYGLSEVNTNGKNIPSGVTANGRNDNDPTACPALNYTTSNPRAY
jgi:starch-binding outer membrane protein, SusD/RagB family